MKDFADAKVKVVRDNYGVPHVIGPDEESVLYGFGFAQAEDHLIEMFRNFLAAQGRLSEYIGVSHKQSDYIVRQLTIPEIASKASRNLNGKLRDMVKSFAYGINRYIKEEAERLPEWMKGLTATLKDILAWATLLTLIWPIRFARREACFRFPQIQVGSNQWVVGGSRTREKTPIFLMDPHLPWTGMHRWYEAHLVGGMLNVYGATWYGFPFIFMGHNERMAWSTTMNFPDVADIFVERLSMDDAYTYLTEKGWERMEEKRIKLRVKTETGVRDEHRTFFYTRHGPVMKFDEEKQLAYAVALEGLKDWSPTLLLEQKYRMNIAKNLESFKEALKLRGWIMTNHMYADVDGNLYYLYNARIHTKSAKYDHTKPRPGWEKESQWGNIIAFEKLPYIQNPQSDWLQNTNVMPWFVTEGSQISPDDHPPYLVDYDAVMNDRGKRVSQVLSKSRDFSIEDAVELATDTFILRAEKEVPTILKMYFKALEKKRTFKCPNEVEKAIETLKNWNYQAEKETAGTTIFHRYLVNRRDGLSVLDALGVTIDYLIERYGNVTVPWGIVHVLEYGGREYPLSGGTMGLPTLWVARGPLRPDGRIVCKGGSSFTMVVLLRKGNIEAYSLLPYGESGNPDSPHYMDQALLKSRKELKRRCFYQDEIEANTESVRIFNT